MRLTDWRSYGRTIRVICVVFILLPGGCWISLDFMDWAPLTRDEDLLNNYFLDRGTFVGAVTQIIVRLKNNL